MCDVSCKCKSVICKPSFQLRNTLLLRIVEEANLRRVKNNVMRSDNENLVVAGFHFYVCGRYLKKVGWSVVQVCCHEGTTFS